MRTSVKIAGLRTLVKERMAQLDNELLKVVRELRTEAAPNVKPIEEHAAACVTCQRNKVGANKPPQQCTELDVVLSGMEIDPSDLVLLLVVTSGRSFDTKSLPALRMLLALPE